jgi:hypothetical protein
MIRIVEPLSALRPNDQIVVRWRGREETASVIRVGPGGVFWSFPHEIAYRRLEQDRYVATLRQDPDFVSWWVSRQGAYASTASAAEAAWDAAREAFAPAAHTTEGALALAVLQGDFTAVAPLIDKLIEQGRVSL